MSATTDSHLRSRAGAALRAPAVILVALASVLHFPACGNAPGGGDESVVRADSAGITIVTSSERRGEAWRLAATPVLSIGLLDGPAEMQLYRVAGARRLTDERIAIANGGSSQIRIYGPDGTHLRSLGGEGEGPGEFTSMSRLDASAEDSLFVWDRRQLRVSVFAPDGAFARDFTLDPPWEGGFAVYSGRFDDGTLMVSVAQVISSPPADGEVLRRGGLILRYDAQGHVSDTIAEFTTRGSLVRSFDGGRALSIYTVPFDPGTVWAIDGRALHRAYGPTFEIRTSDGTGRLVRAARVARAPRLVDDGLRAAATDAALADAGDDVSRADLRDAWDMMPFPDSVAAYDRLLGDPAGRVWARRHPLPAETDAVWDVFDAGGALEATVTTPVSSTVWQIDEGLVLVSELDELDVERVALYPLEGADDPEPPGSAADSRSQRR